MKYPLILLVAIIAFAGSCKRGDDTAPVKKDTAGKGGNAILKVTPRHHGVQIDSCTIYLKYNAIDAPTYGKYDDSARCILTGGIPVATFSGLRKGNYYIYGYGYDPKLVPPGPVKGGFAYPLQQETTQSYDLAISED